MANSLACDPNHIGYEHLVLISADGAQRYVYRIDLAKWIAGGATLVTDDTPVPVVPDCLWNWNDGLGEPEGGEPEEPVAPEPTTGEINTLSIPSLVGGSGYVEGIYEDVALTGGTGTGAQADINVDAGGAVTVVSLDNGGADYTAGDVLSADAANLGGSGSGFSISVGSIKTVNGAIIYANGVRR